MCVLALVIRNFSRSTSEANFSTPVNVVLTVVALGIYAVFSRHKWAAIDHFILNVIR